MCEPSHSINQFPDNDDQGPTQPRIDAAAQKSKKKGLWEWAKKIMGRLHYSKFGAGHSEGMALGREGFFLLPEPTRYEAHWWERKVCLDGSFRDSRFLGNARALAFEREQALEAATCYAHRSSIGNLSTLRKFLELSIAQSPNPTAYLRTMVECMILPQHRDKAVNKIKGVFGIKHLKSSGMGWNLSLAQVPGVHLDPQTFMFGRREDVNKEARQKLAKLAAGFTRKRGILVPCWADDGNLWT